MKKLFSILFLLSLISSFSQTILIVNNTPTAPAGDLIYASLQEAHDAANPGDTIYIQPSVTNYGSVSIIKEVHLRGIGHALTKDLPLRSTVTSITFSGNSTVPTNASGSTVEGLVLSGQFYFGTNSHSDITIRNCSINGVAEGIYSDQSLTNLQVINCYSRLEFLFWGPVTNLLVRNSLITGTIYFQSTGQISATITNNIIYGGFYKRTQGDNLTIVNNNFMGSKGVNDFISFPQSLAANQIFLDVIVANNIFHGRTPSDVPGGGSSSGNFQRNVFSSNLTYETGNDELPPSGGSAGNTGLDNLEATNPLFASVPINNTWSSSHDFTLQAGSPALNAGSDGTDIGISGGAYPMTGTNFSLFTTQVPTIETLNVEPIILPTDNLDIRIKVKAN